MTSVRIRSGRDVPRRRERLLAVGSRCTVVPRGEQATQIVAHVGVVVRQQNARAAAPSRVPEASPWHVGSSTPSRRPAASAALRSTKASAPRRGRIRCVRAALDPVACGRCALPSGMRTMKRGAAIRARFRPDVAPVQLDQFLNQREADAAALMGPSARALDAMEALEDSGSSRLGNARAGVATRRTACSPSCRSVTLDLARRR